MILKLLAGTLFAASLAAIGQTPPPAYMEPLRAVSEALANRDAGAFLDPFDPRMPGFAVLQDEIRELTAAAQEIGSTIDVITDEGGDRERSLELDWLLTIDQSDPRRQVMKCQLEKQGRHWRITRLEPVEFFRK